MTDYIDNLVSLDCNDRGDLCGCVVFTNPFFIGLGIYEYYATITWFKTCVEEDIRMFYQL